MTASTFGENFLTHDAIYVTLNATTITRNSTAQKCIIGWPIAWAVRGTANVVQIFTIRVAPEFGTYK